MEVNNSGTIMIRTSERRLFTQCRQAWWWEYVERLKPKHTKPALSFGDLVHQALAAYYLPGKKRGPHPAGTFRDLYAELDEPIIIKADDERADALALGVDMLEGYIDHWGNDSHILVVQPEMPAQVDVLDKHGKYLCTYVLTFDAVIQDLRTMEFGLLETKTAASISTAHLPLDEQAGSYFTFAPDWLRHLEVLKPKQDISFILYNFLRKSMRDTRPVNAAGHRLNKPTKEALLAAATEQGLVAGKSMKVDDLTAMLTKHGVDVALLGEVSKSQPPPYFHRQPVYRNNHDRANVLYRVRAQAWEMNLVRQGILPVYKNPSGSYPDTHCLACGFRDMCELHETGADWEAMRDETMTTWDPYEVHNDNMEDELL